MVTRGQRGGGGERQAAGKEVQSTMYKLEKHKDILYNTGNYSHYVIVTFNGV